jgi:hypothetical protein
MRHYTSPIQTTPTIRFSRPAFRTPSHVFSRPSSTISPVRCTLLSSTEAIPIPAISSVRSSPWPRVLLRVTRTSFTERSRVVRRLTDTVSACRRHTTARTCRTPISTGLAQAWRMRLLLRLCKAISLALPSRVTEWSGGCRCPGILARSCHS